MTQNDHIGTRKESSSNGFKVIGGRPLIVVLPKNKESP